MCSAADLADRHPQLAWSPEQWLEHDIAQADLYVRCHDDKIAEAAKRVDQAHDAVLLARAPEWVTGKRHTAEEIQAAEDAEWAARVELFKLSDRRANMVGNLEEMQVAQQRSEHRAPARRPVCVPPTVRARTVSPRPRERRERRTRRSSSSSDDGSRSSSDDPDPPLGGALSAARRAA